MTAEKRTADLSAGSGISFEISGDDLMTGKKRLCIYFLHDGAVSDAAEYFLRALSAFCSKIVMISGREAEWKGRDSLGVQTEQITAGTQPAGKAVYGEVLERTGWEELAGWDEVLLTDDSVMGPVYPLEEMFSCMEGRAEADFWGVTSGGRSGKGEKGRENADRLEGYIPFRFIVFRNRLLKSREFRGFWQQAAETGGEDQEAAFTKRMEAAGYRWEVYLQTPENGQLTTDYLLMDPAGAVRRRCPVFLKDSFTLPQMEYICASAGEQPWELFQYLKNNTAYDTDLILRNLIQTCHQDDIVRTLRKITVLPSGYAAGNCTHSLKTALIMHLYYMDLLEESVHYASAMPEDADIRVFTCSEENRKKISEAFSVLKNPVEVRVTQNRGRDVGSLLVGAADLQEQYDLICFYHDKKTNHLQPLTAGKSSAYLTAACALSSACYVRNVISYFEENPLTGMLSGMTPNHAGFLGLLGMEWGPNYPLTKQLAEELGFRVPLSEDHIPAVGLGNVFWYRTKALAPMFRKKWQYTDFPEEPVGIDGTVLHAMERLYPFAVQEAGYLPERVMPDHLAALEIDNLRFYVREYNRVRLAAQIHGDLSAVIEKEKERLDPQLYAQAQAANFPTQLRLSMKRHLPGWLYRGTVGIKRAVFGPRGVSFEEGEEADAGLLNKSSAKS